MRVSVIVVCMLDSIHTARWLTQFVNESIDFNLIPSSPHRKIHPQIVALAGQKCNASYSIKFQYKYLGLPLWLADRLLGKRILGRLIRKSVAAHNPDFVHALELQNAGYSCLRAFKKGVPKGTKLISTNWGSDIYWFQRFPRHEKKLRRLLEVSDYYSAECQRDVNLALELGFMGKVMPIIPNSGALLDEDLNREKLPTSERSTISVKGYQSWVGRANVALKALEHMSEELRGWRIVVFSANFQVLRLAKRIAKRTGLVIEAHGKGKLTRQEVLGILAESKIYIGISQSDGVSTTLLEAMAMGAFPVQTSTACCDEWFTDSGITVDKIEVNTVEHAIKKAILMSQDPEHVQKNMRTVQFQAGSEKTASQALSFYLPAGESAKA